MKENKMIKKLFAFVMTFCLVIGCSNMTVLAAGKEDITVKAYTLNITTNSARSALQEGDIDFEVKRGSTTLITRSDIPISHYDSTLGYHVTGYTYDFDLDPSAENTIAAKLIIGYAEPTSGRPSALVEQMKANFQNKVPGTYVLQATLAVDDSILTQQTFQMKVLSASEAFDKLITLDYNNVSSFDGSHFNGSFTAKKSGYHYIKAVEADIESVHWNIQCYTNDNVSITGSTVSKAYGPSEGPTIDYVRYSFKAGTTYYFRLSNTGELVEINTLYYENNANGGIHPNSSNAAANLSVPAESVILDKTTLSLEPTEKYELTASILPKDTTDTEVAWTSSNNNIATVNADGLVTGVAPGTAEVTATIDGRLTATCAVEVVPVPAQRVELNKHTLDLFAGDSATLAATVTPANTTDKTVTWSSTNTAVATVDNAGKITAKAIGTTTIIATTSNGKTASCLVNVTPVKATTVTLNTTATKLNKGTTGTLTAIVLPTNATNKGVVWSSNDSAIVSVDANGTITALKKGSAIITATAADGSGAKASCTVTVLVPATKIAVPRTSMTLKKGTKVTLASIVTPAETTDKITYTTSKKSVVTVTSKGKITAKKAGKATITLKAGTKTKKIKITVVTKIKKVKKLSFSKKAITVKKGAIQFLNVKINPTSATEQLKWSSSKKSVVTVDKNSGKITAKKKGTAKITVKAGKKKATVTVKVKN